MGAAITSRARPDAVRGCSQLAVDTAAEVVEPYVEIEFDFRNFLVAVFLFAANIRHSDRFHFWLFLISQAVASFTSTFCSQSSHVRRRLQV